MGGVFGDNVFILLEEGIFSDHYINFQTVENDNTQDGVIAVLTPDICGDYVATLTVTDTKGATGTTEQTISCANIALSVGTIA